VCVHRVLVCTLLGEKRGRGDFPLKSKLAVNFRGLQYVLEKTVEKIQFQQNRLFGQYLYYEATASDLMLSPSTALLTVSTHFHRP